MSFRTILIGMIVVISIIFTGCLDNQDADSNQSVESIAAALPFSGEPEVLKCGETGRFKKADITIGGPISSIIVVRENTSITENHAYLRIPVTIEAKKNFKIGADKFGADYLAEQEDCMPYKLKLNEGDVYKGTLYIKWKHSRPTEYTDAPNAVECTKRGFKGIWNISYDKSMKELKNPNDVDGILPNTPIKAKVVVDEISYMGACSNNDYDRIGTLKVNDDFYLYTIISGDDLDKWEKYKEHGKKLTIEGIVRNITKESGGNEPFIHERTMVSNVEIK